MSINSKSQTIVEGLDELIKAFMKLGDEAMPYVKDGANEAGAHVLSKAKAKVSVRTGNLKNRLKLSKAKISGKYPYRVSSKVTARKGAAYMVPLELGHRLVIKGKTAGAVKERPFLRPAADESKDEVVSVISRSLDKALKEMGGNR